MQKTSQREHVWRVRSTTQGRRLSVAADGIYGAFCLPHFPSFPRPFFLSTSSKKKFFRQVPCESDTDCYSRCGEHPITGRSYRCTRNLSLYTYAGYGTPDLNDENVAAGIRIYPDTAFYTIDYPGDDRFDVANHSKGVCTDYNLAYGTTGCLSFGGAKGTLAFAGCTGALMGWATTWCGTQVEVDGPDYVTNVGISADSFSFPRVLVPSARVNGKEQLEVTCANGFDCQLKCEYFDRVARAGGYPSPAACALCHPPCPDNGGTTFVQGFHAFFHDFAKAMRLAANCGLTLGLGTACLCEVWMLVRGAHFPCCFSNHHHHHHITARCAHAHADEADLDAKPGKQHTHT